MNIYEYDVVSTAAVYLVLNMLHNLKIGLNIYGICITKVEDFLLFQRKLKRDVKYIKKFNGKSEII